MGLQGLRSLLAPRSVAVIGASTHPGKIGGRPLQFLQRAGYGGEIYPVNPKSAEVQGIAAVGSVGELPAGVETAIVALPQTLVAEAVDAGLARGIENFVVFTAGFGETGNEGAAAEAALARRINAGGARLVGPNSLGVFSASSGFFGTFATALDNCWPKRGNVAIATQSGAFGSYSYALAAARGLGFSHFVATGNEAGISVAEVIEALAADDDTAVIMAALEGARDGPELLRALAAARDAGKPVVMMKTGRSEAGRVAADSHTGSLAGDDEVYQAVFDELGVHRAATLEEYVDLAYGFSVATRPAGRRLGIVTTSGGVGVYAADHADALGFELPRLGEAELGEIRTRLPLAAGSNPVDSSAQILTNMESFEHLLEVMARSGKYDGLLLFLAHIGRDREHAATVREMLQRLRGRRPDFPVLVSMLAEPDVRSGFEALGIPVYAEPQRALAALAALAIRPSPARRTTGASQDGIEAVDTGPASGPRGEATHQPARDEASTEGRAARRSRSGPRGSPVESRNYTEPEAAALLESWGVPMASYRIAHSAREAAALGAELGFPVAMKVVAAEIRHKSELGGVVLDVADGDAAAAAYGSIVDNVARHRGKSAPGGGAEDVMLSPMQRGEVELILGCRVDPVFGAFVLVGLGGVLAEVFRDTALRRAPVDAATAERMLRSLKGFRLLEGYRGRPKAALSAAIDAIVRFSAFAAANAARLSSAEINPLLISTKACIGVDALIETRN